MLSDDSNFFLWWKLLLGAIMAVSYRVERMIGNMLLLLFIPIEQMLRERKRKMKKKIVLRINSTVDF